MRIADREIGQIPVVSAELSLNHSGDLSTALKMIDEVHKAGAQAVKVQYFRAEDFADPDSDKTITYKQPFKMDTASQFAGFDLLPDNPTEEVTENYFAFFKRHEISLEFMKACYDRAKKRGLIFGVTPTSAEGVREVAEFCDYFKVASDMVSNLDMRCEMLAYEIPQIISTGHLTLKEIYEHSTKDARVLWLHCQSEYPAKDPLLWRLTALKKRGYLVGYSDHSIGIETAIRAVELGAVWVEKHFKISDDCPDAEFSADPGELAQLVKAIT